MSLSPKQIEVLALELPELFALYQAVSDGIKALPPAASRKPSDYTALAVAVLPQIGAIADAVEADLASAPTPAPAPAAAPHA